MPRDPRSPILRAVLLVTLLGALALGLLLVGSAGAEPADRPPAPQQDPATWPQWRGPERDATVEEAAPWPDDLEGLRATWRVELGPSYSGPIVGMDRVFTTETRDERFEVVSAYDRATGELLWSKQWEGSMEVPFFAKSSGDWIRSTPAWDGETLFVGGMLEVLVALDGETGAERWRIDFPARFGTERPPFGFVCSPLLADGHLFVEAARSFFRIDKETGEILWRSGPWHDGDMTNDGTFSSPVLVEVDGGEQLLVQTRLDLRGLDPETGEVLWVQPVPSFRGMNILTPMIWDGPDGPALYTSTYRNASYLYRLHSPQGEEGTWRSEKAWENPVKAYMSSPVRVGDVVYQHLGNNRLAALDLASGETLWITKPFGKYWSLARQGDKVLALDAEGELILWRPDPQAFRLLDRRSIADSPTWGHLAVAGDQVFVREQNALVAWRWTAGEGG